MIGNRTPRLLLLAVALGVAVSGVMLSVFYGQYRWLADQIVDASSAEYNELAEANFEQQARSRLQIAANVFLDLSDGEQSSGIYLKLNTSGHRHRWRHRLDRYHRAQRRVVVINGSDPIRPSRHSNSGHDYTWHFRLS